ncbi:hypothetical protein D516_1189 [Rhodobacter sp. AKP1]|nr:hypothetical protein D516_1189 [Rhodobacter sp. AKP1]
MSPPSVGWWGGSCLPATGINEGNGRGRAPVPCAGPVSGHRPTCRGTGRRSCAGLEPRGACIYGRPWLACHRGTPRLGCAPPKSGPDPRVNPRGRQCS